MRRSLNILAAARLVICTGLVLCCAMTANARIVFSFDYSLDHDGLFDSSAAGRAAQAAMERAGQILSDRIGDNLTPITPGSGNLWSARIVNPGTGATDFDPALAGVASNIVKVYVGSRLLTGLELGDAGAGAAVASGSQTFLDNATSRGQSGALAATKTDFGPWGGSIAFDAAANWYFGQSAGGLTASKIDFLSVATHELMHLLGFSMSQASWSALVSNGRFSGTKATASNGGQAPLVTGSHWLGMSSTVGPNGPIQVALMDPSTPTGTRRRMTQLDWAALADIGWEVAIPGDANANGVVDFADFQALEVGFGQTSARWSHGDFNEDGIVDTADFAMLVRNYGRRLDGRMAEISAAERQMLSTFAADAPEPGSIVWLIGLAAVVMMKRPRMAH